MKIESIIKSGGINATDFAQILGKTGTIIDLMETGEPALARSNWRMQGDTLAEPQSRDVYQADGQPSKTALEAPDNEYHGETAISIGIWDGVGHR
ncbi:MULTISPECIES: hypothetical protein [unclassified Burkholderia]|uniref:hypothetical protein n=1 Tax=unclassified Burkholderia TaxID=2613784 RepID=UPI000B18F4B7|nr:MULTISPECIES: hypothetical protein [unclassified Burkholderia]